MDDRRRGGPGVAWLCFDARRNRPAFSMDSSRVNQFRSDLPDNAMLTRRRRLAENTRCRIRRGIQKGGPFDISETALAR